VNLGCSEFRDDRHCGTNDRHLEAWASRMKPSLTTLGVTFSCLCAWQTVCAQKPADAPLAFVGSQPWTAPQVWGTIPPPKPLPYGYTWNEYRGADIEHPLYAPRHAHSVARATSGPSVFAAMCCWFDKLFHCHKTIPTAACEVCQTSDVPLPPVPTLPMAAPAVEDYAAEPARSHRRLTSRRWSHRRLRRSRGR
jgi:hypothetical protein